MVQASLGHRISKHEAICAERMKTLFKAIDEMRKDIKDLRQDMNKGKVAVNVLNIFSRFSRSYHWLSLNGMARRKKAVSWT